MFPEECYVLVDGAITEYHIAKEERYEDLNHKLFCINDIEDIIRTYPRRRVAAILRRSISSNVVACAYRNHEFRSHIAAVK